MLPNILWAVRAGPTKTGYAFDGWYTAIGGQSLDMGNESAVPTGFFVGDDRANAAALIEVDAPDISMNAQKLSIGGYQDWFYPSQNELLLMYKNLKAKGLGDFRSDVYWSSSLAPDRKRAIAVDFYEGQTGYWPMRRAS
jgi:hypothetical protein